jgi:hypothetical protein
MDAMRYALFMNSQAGSGFIPPPVTGLVQPFFLGLAAYDRTK